LPQQNVIPARLRHPSSQRSRNYVKSHVTVSGKCMNVTNHEDLKVDVTQVEYERSLLASL
jgi:hypothetical protein